MKHKYVIIDSSKENHNSVDAKFKVQIPQGITGTTRVCVKSFSMPNSYYNIYGDLKTAKFVEFYRPTSGGDWVYEVFSFNLAEGYTETDTLFSELQSKFTNASGNEITRESVGSTTVQHVGEIDNPTIRQRQSRLDQLPKQSIVRQRNSGQSHRSLCRRPKQTHHLGITRIR